jgi:CRISPR system Cascade subunit CasA
MLYENDASGLSINLLSDEIVTIARNRRLSLTELLAAMARDEVRGFTALRPHQRTAWHMFLVQLAAVALWHAGRFELPKSGDEWRAHLRGLTPEFSQDEPWCLVVGDRTKPAFMQPADPGGLKWSQVATPDALDMLITSRNHDLKTQVAHRATPEDWVFALVSLQTMEGYGGRGNQGIARMNSGASSRPLLGLAPADNVGESPDPSRWWGRDVNRLLADRHAGNNRGPGQVGGPALIWCQSWPEEQQIDISTLDPCFIEICRRVRLAAANGRITAYRTTSKKARIDAKAFNGAIGDPWAPVHKTESKSLTLGEGSFTFKRLVELLLHGDWELPLLARVGPDRKSVV